MRNPDSLRAECRRFLCTEAGEQLITDLDRFSQPTRTPMYELKKTDSLCATVDMARAVGRTEVVEYLKGMRDD